MARFSGIPALPQSNIDEGLFIVVNALKENVELLTGTRGESDGASQAITKSALTVVDPPAATITALSAKGYGVSVSNVTVPTLTDYQNLLRDVARLINDVAQLRATVATLVTQLRA